MKKHYDVIVMGRGIAALSTAALLARRDFTVLVLGHTQPPPSYSVLGHQLSRSAFTFLGGSSPVWHRILSELAQSQAWRRRTLDVVPTLQAIAPQFRLDVSLDQKLFAREIDREFPELYHVVEELYAKLGGVNQLADAAFSADAVWPPGTFWERRETSRFAANLPYVHTEQDADLLSDFPRGHFYRRLVRSSVLFGTHLSTTPPPFASARIHGAYTKGLARLRDEATELESFLVERICAHGGEVRRDGRVTSIQSRKGAPALSVYLHGEDHPSGATFLITDAEGEAVAALAEGQGIHKRALREWPRITSTVGRFVVSMIVRTVGVPVAMGPLVILFPRGAESQQSGRALPIHVVRCDLEGGLTRLTAEVLLPEHGALRLGEARRFVVRALVRELPFLERHLLIVDSVHDGLPVWQMSESGPPVAIDRRSLGLSMLEPMVRQYEVDPPGYLGISGEPLRGPIERTLLVGRSVLPALGQEGELLAAWGAARLVTKSDRRKATMRRDMWTKMEFG